MPVLFTASLTIESDQCINLHACVDQLFKRYMRAHASADGGTSPSADAMDFGVFERFAKDFGIYPHICRDAAQLAAVFQAVLLMPGCSSDADDAGEQQRTINLDGFGRVLTILNKQVRMSCSPFMRVGNGITNVSLGLFDSYL